MHDMPHKDNFTAPCGSASTNANIGILNSFHSLRISNLVLTSGKPLPCYWTKLHSVVKTVMLRNCMTINGMTLN